jgi:cell division septation protein DedD
MVMDYSEKRTVREGLERKPVQKNRPRKESGGMFALWSIAVLLVTFGVGVATGWFLFKGTHKTPPAPAVAQAAKKNEPAAAAVQQKQEPPPETPLTFYNTLPAGGKAAMGSGMNLKKPQTSHPAPASAPAPAAAAPAAAAEKQPHYTVQVASYRDKKEAEAAQTKMAAKGVAAYLVESKLQDKGVWYRLRVGKNLSKPEAEELAGKSEEGAIVLPE